MEKDKIDILELFRNEKNNGRFLKISAPMVRYSKLEFRTLLRNYGIQLCYTPMIIADSFCLSNEARQNEFTTGKCDSPLIAQFAAKNPIELVKATELIYPYVDGIDLNCGCPQRWAITAGYGCGLLKQPELLHDIIAITKRNFPSNFSISAKLRICDKNLLNTIELCRRLEKCGITFLAIHGRKPWQKTSEPVDIDGINEIRKSIQVPFVFNGDIKTMDNANDIYKLINCDGIMVARGLLSNPTMFATIDNNIENDDDDGVNNIIAYNNKLLKTTVTATRAATATTTTSPITSKKCIQDWIDLAYAAGDRITFQCFHHHLTFMMEKWLHKRLRVKFNNFTKKCEIFDFLENTFDIRPTVIAAAGTTDPVSGDINNSNIISSYNSRNDLISNYNNNNFLCIYDDRISFDYRKLFYELKTSMKNNYHNNSSNDKITTITTDHYRNGKFFETYKILTNSTIGETIAATTTTTTTPPPPTTTSDYLDHLDFMDSTIFDI